MLEWRISFPPMSLKVLKSIVGQSPAAALKLMLGTASVEVLKFGTTMAMVGISRSGGTAGGEFLDMPNMALVSFVSSSFIWSRQSRVMVAARMETNFLKGSVFKGLAILDFLAGRGEQTLHLLFEELDSSVDRQAQHGKASEGMMEFVLCENVRKGVKMSALSGNAVSVLIRDFC